MRKSTLAIIAVAASVTMTLAGCSTSTSEPGESNPSEIEIITPTETPTAPGVAPKSTYPPAPEGVVDGTLSPSPTAPQPTPSATVTDPPELIASQASKAKPIINELKTKKYTVDEATKMIEDAGFTARVVIVDGEGQNTTDTEVNINRINLVVEKGKIVNASLG